MRAGLTREMLAERAGLAASTLAALESDRRQRPHSRTIAALADALALDAAESARLNDLAKGVGVAPSEAERVPRVAPLVSERRTALPLAPTPLIGRDVEIEQAGVLLDPV